MNDQEIKRIITQELERSKSLEFKATVFSEPQTISESEKETKLLKLGSEVENLSSQISELQSKINSINLDIESIKLKPPQFNYSIESPDGREDARSSIQAEINFNPSTPHSLVLQNNRLSWVGEQTHPFRITATQSEEGSPIVISVNAGTVNGVLASNWTSSFSSSGAGAVYVVLNANAGINRIASTSLSFAPNPPSGEATAVRWGVPSSFQILLGIVVKLRVFQVVTSNLSYNVVKRLTTEKNLPQAGLLPYDNWYTWVKVGG